MKRSRIHTLFGLTALGFGLLAAYQGSRLQQAHHVNEAIAIAAANSGVVGLEEAVPEASFARAFALAESGDYEAAFKAYKALIRIERSDLQRAALYNLGNLHMREALKNGADSAAKSLPLIELAKQSYRDVLRNDPADWDARYNLERALWLAPEDADDLAENNSSSVPKERRVINTLQFEPIELP